MNEQEVRILEKERQEFYRLWHSYHAKYKIPYSHDEKEKFFNSVALIFLEEKSLKPKVEEIAKLREALQNIVIEHSCGDECAEAMKDIAKSALDRKDD